MSDNILNNQNRAYSELYLIRGTIYEQRNDLDNARAAYQKAVLYNKNEPIYAEALKRIAFQ
jgi:Flp pilus assembly protein TadD